MLILPACYALSDVEARRIAEFARAGGTVIADFACGLFDPARPGAGARRARRPLRRGARRQRDARRLLRRPPLGGDRSGRRLRLPPLARALRHPPAPAPQRLRRRRAQAARRAPSGRREGPGRLPQPLAAALSHGARGGRGDEERRRPFLDAIRRAGVDPWIAVSPRSRAAAGRSLCEATYWSKGERTFVFVVQNVPIASRSTGGGGAVGLDDGEVPSRSAWPLPSEDVRDERTGRKLPDGEHFSSGSMPRRRCCFSFAGLPPELARLLHTASLRQSCILNRISR